jgi:hypothetical protein
MNPPTQDIRASYVASNDLVKTSLVVTNSSILLDTDADLKVLHVAKAAFSKPVDRYLGDDGLECRHPGLGGGFLEDNVQVGLRGGEHDGLSRLSRLNGGRGGNGTTRATRHRASDYGHGDRRSRLAVHTNRSELAVAQDGAPQVVHGGAGTVAEYAAAEETVAVAGVSMLAHVARLGLDGVTHRSFASPSVSGT